MRPLIRYLAPALLSAGALLSCDSGTTAGNGTPAAVITAPASGTLFSGGETIAYAGTGTDPDDGALPGGQFTVEALEQAVREAK